jgi:hypothetical protein
MMTRRFRLFLPLVLFASLSPCESVTLLRPSVISPLDPGVVRLLNELPAGEPAGEFHAFGMRTGQVPWTFQTGSGIHRNPSPTA